MVSEKPKFRQRVRRVLEPIPGAVPFTRLVVETAAVALRYRATGLAAEAAFFILLSLPPLLVALVAGAGFASEWLGPGTLTRMSNALESWALTFLTPETVEEVIMPTFNQTLSVGRADVLSLGFLVALWSGSRVLHIFLETISIMYGQGGDRGILKARLASLVAYVVSVFIMGVTLPLLLIGPRYLLLWLPQQLDIIVRAYWPAVGALGLFSLTALFHFATPSRSPFWRDFPGALLTVLCWVGGSVLIRSWAEAATGSWSVFGPLSAPIVLMVYLYFISFAVLLGASLNAAIRRLWPPPDYHGPIVVANRWWEQRRSAIRRRRERRPVSSAEEAEELENLDGIPGPR